MSFSNVSKLLICVIVFSLSIGSIFFKASANVSIIERLRGAIFYGNASWYGGKFHGRMTANGEKYNKNRLTAAHKTLPFGTKVKVTNMENDKSVVVKINDRGPFKPGRIIDLSEEAAEKIGSKASGVAYVKVQVLENGDNKRYYANNTKRSRGRLRKFSKKFFLNES